MLVLTRKTSQVIKLGADITITVVRTSQGSVRLGIEAPPDIRIARAELGELIRSLSSEPKAA
jgi:carbon storage regulator